MTIEKFRELFTDLSIEEQVTIFNEYCHENCSDDELYEFDDDFFDTFFEGKPAEAVRACFFGDIKNWNDEYIYFNGYANLVSLSKYEVEDHIECYISDIFDHPDCWKDYIEDDEEEEEEED